MKKISFFVLMASLVFGVTQAQTTTKKKPNWGIKLGVNSSNLRVENGTNSKWKGGLATGVYFNIKAGNKFSFQPEFLYSSMGGRDIAPSEQVSVRLNYFSLPILAKYQLCNKFYVMAGPQIDVLIKAKTKNMAGFDDVTNDFKENSFNGTAGFEFWPISRLGLSARYIYGFNNIVDNGAELKNQGIQIMAALKL